MFEAPLQTLEQKIQMSEVNQSNVAIKIKHDDSFIFQPEEILQQNNQQQIDVKQVPIITQNVPFTNPKKSISKWYIFFNINLNGSVLIIIVLPALSILPQLALYFLISYTIISYLVYLAIAYKFSNLTFLAGLRSLHEYRATFQRLVIAKCHLKFTYIPSRSRIDQNVKKYEEEYKRVKIIDKSGRLYNIQRYYSIALIKYNKKFYYRDTDTKAKIHSQFHNFVQKCKKQFETGKRKLLSSRQKIEFTIQDLSSEIGYYTQEDNHYKCTFLLTLFLGLGIYYQYYLRNSILRYEMDIVKEICLN